MRFFLRGRITLAAGFWGILENYNNYKYIPAAERPSPVNRDYDPCIEYRYIAQLRDTISTSVRCFPLFPSPRIGTQQHFPNSTLDNY